MNISRRQIIVIVLGALTLILIGVAVVIATQLADSESSTAPEDTSAAYDPGWGLCDNSCTSDSDCLVETDAGVPIICNTEIGRCVNAVCPDDTIFGNLCHCRTPVQGCGEPCGGAGYPLCNSESQSVCRYIVGPSCDRYSQPYCVPTDDTLPEGYSTPNCVARDTGNSYLAGPGNQTSFSPAEVVELCNSAFADVCGDGQLDPSEGCDDGNTTNGDGCSSTCRVEACGNSIIEGNEQCDDGNTTSGDGCSATCTTEACGDGVRQASEACDDGNNTNGDGCSSTCQSESCGNGVIDSGEACDVTGCATGYTCTNTCVCVASTLPDTALVSDEFDRILVGALLLVAGFAFLQIRSNARTEAELEFAAIPEPVAPIPKVESSKDANYIDERSARRKAYVSTVGKRKN